MLGRRQVLLLTGTCLTPPFAALGLVACVCNAGEDRVVCRCFVRDPLDTSCGWPVSCLMRCAMEFWNNVTCDEQRTNKQVIRLPPSRMATHAQLAAAAVIGVPAPGVIATVQGWVKSWAGGRALSSALVSLMTIVVGVLLRCDVRWSLGKTLRATSNERTSQILRLPPRRTAAAAVIGVPEPYVVVPTGVIAAGQKWAKSWASGALSSALVSLMIVVVGVLILQTDPKIVTRALSSHTQLPMPTMSSYVERREVADIVHAIENVAKYIVVDGGNGVGKSVIVKAAASRLSETHTVLWSNCNKEHTAVLVLRSLFRFDREAESVVSLITASFAKLSPSEPPSVTKFQAWLLSADAAGPEPIFVVEMAERLEIEELKTLLDLAKEVADERRGRFIFVFSPSDKLSAIRSFGSFTRAKIIHVGDLSVTEASLLLTRSGCSADQASALYALIGGHLPHLVSDTALEYCRGSISLADVKGVLLADIGRKVKDVDDLLGLGGSACDGLIGVMTEVRPKPEVLNALLKEHLVVGSLRKRYYVDSQMVRTFVDARCARNHKTLFTDPATTSVLPVSSGQ
jgi:hypothetical protein